MLGIVLHFLLLGLFERAHALEHLVPVDKGSIKFRAVDTHKLRFATDSQSAGTAHTRTVNHDGVQRDLAGDAMLLCRKVRELHHNGRTDSKDFVNVFLLDELLDANSHHAFFAV